MNLPPLPKPYYPQWSHSNEFDAYTADQLRQAQREAVAAAVPEGYTDDQIAQAALEAEIPDSKCFQILIALYGMTAAALEVKS